MTGRFVNTEREGGFFLSGVGGRAHYSGLWPSRPAGGFSAPLENLPRSPLLGGPGMQMSRLLVSGKGQEFRPRGQHMEIERGSGPISPGSAAPYKHPVSLVGVLQPADKVGVWGGQRKMRPPQPPTGHMFLLGRHPDLIRLQWPRRSLSPTVRLSPRPQLLNATAVDLQRSRFQSGGTFGTWHGTFFPPRPPLLCSPR